MNESFINLLSKTKDFSSSNKITIEQFIDFDKNNLAEHKILYGLFGKAWLWFYNITVLVILLSEILSFFYALTSAKANYWILTIFLPGSIILFFMIKTYRKKISPILKANNHAFNLNLKPNYNIFKEKEVIHKIQNMLLQNYIKSNTLLLTSKQIREIIEALKYDSSETNYVYQSLTTGISFFAIILAAFLASWFRISVSFNDFVQIATKAAIILVVVAFLFFFIEDSFIKDFIHNKRNRYKRLIRILENYNLNNSTEDSHYY